MDNVEREYDGYYRGWIRLIMKIGFPDTGSNVDTIENKYYGGGIGFPDTVLPWIL